MQNIVGSVTLDIHNVNTQNIVGSVTLGIHTLLYKIILLPYLHICKRINICLKTSFSITERVIIRLCLNVSSER